MKKEDLGKRSFEQAIKQASLIEHQANNWTRLSFTSLEGKNYYELWDENHVMRMRVGVW